MCKEVDGLCLKLYFCTPGLVRTSADSTPYIGANSPIPLEPFFCYYYYGHFYKSLGRPGRKQARKYIRDDRDFNNIEKRAVIKFFPARQGAEGNSRHSERNISLFSSWPEKGLISTTVRGSVRKYPKCDVSKQYNINSVCSVVSIFHK